MSIVLIHSIISTQQRLHNPSTGKGRCATGEAELSSEPEAAREQQQQTKGSILGAGGGEKDEQHVSL